jgi:Domain of unknown function (DUF3291)/Darcynin, domain of unknown function
VKLRVFDVEFYSPRVTDIWQWDAVDHHLRCGKNTLTVCPAAHGSTRTHIMSGYELAQLNIATLKGPLDSPLLADFVANLDRINAVAEGSAGFVWRLQTSDGDATALRPLGDDTLVNMSVWKDVASLRNYVYRSAHVEVMRRRKEWFEHMSSAFVVLWWVPKGHRPSIQEALSRLELLRSAGPSEEAFTFRQAYLPPDTQETRSPFDLGDECPAL